MKTKLTIAAAFAVAIQGCAIAAPKPEIAPETVVLENGKDQVVARDVDAAFLRFPRELRDEARAYPNVILKNVDAVFVNRVVANRAREAGLDKDPVVKQRLRQVEEAFLAQRYLDDLYEKMPLPDLAARAEEIYKSDPKRFTDPPTAGILHIAVGLSGRTPELAMQRAQEAEKRLAAGEDFAAVASLYTDDPRFREIGPSLGVVPISALDPNLREAVEKAKAGDTTGPIVTRGGVHILRITEKHPARLQPFDNVKDKLVADESDAYRRRKIEEMLNGIRTSPSNTVYADRLEALRSDMDVSKIEKSHSDSIQKLQAGS